jgi:CubicO group peptidase (beta-lactamase class C family)
LIRHADPLGRSLGQFFAQEVAKPLGLDFYIGLPAFVDRDRVAYVHAYPWVELLRHLNTLPPRFVAALLNPLGLTGRTLANPKGIGNLGAFNREEVCTVEIPAANGIGTARSVAKAYGCVATGGAELRLTADVLAALSKPAVPPTKGLRDKVLQVDISFSLGCLKPFPKLTFGSSDNAFGTPGAGGSFGFADPDTGIGFAYAMNKAGFHLYNDPRELALRQALFHDIVGARSQK